MAVSVIKGAISLARRVMPPSKAKIGIAEKAHPLPMEEVMTMMIIKSSTDLTASVE